jgi:hypothetical protein
MSRVLNTVEYPRCEPQSGFVRSGDDPDENDEKNDYGRMR